MKRGNHVGRLHPRTALGAVLGALLLVCVGCSGPAFELAIGGEAGAIDVADQVSLTAPPPDGGDGGAPLSNVQGDGGPLEDSGPALDAGGGGVDTGALPPLQEAAAAVDAESTDAGQEAGQGAEASSDVDCPRGSPGGPYTVSSPVIDLGIAQVGSDTLTDIYITNNGCRATLTAITEDVSPPVSPYVFGGSLINECQGQVLGQGQACDYQVVFRPQATGPFTATVAATINGQVLTFGVSGFGT
jgi:hypothetical protein